MALPTVEEAFANMDRVGSDRVLEGLTRRSAELNAAAQVRLGDNMLAASLGISDSIDKQIAVERESAVMLVEVQRASTETVRSASDALRNSVDALTKASNANTTEMSKWAKSTSEQTEAIANWTKRLTWATGALVLSAVVQILAMWFAKK